MIPYRYPVQEPNMWAGRESPDLHTFPIRTIPTVEFRVEEPTYQMTTEQMEDSGLRYWQYLCYSCLYACGDKKNCFKTTWAKRKYMRLGATLDQVEEMKVHAEQHSIIWAWARQQDK